MCIIDWDKINYGLGLITLYLVCTFCELIDLFGFACARSSSFRCYPSYFATFVQIFAILKLSL